MNRKLYYILGAVLLLGFAGFSLAAFRTSLTPYVSFAEASRPTGGARIVQIAGGLAKDSASYDEASTSLHFKLQDPASGETLAVRYRGLRPANFEDAVEHRGDRSLPRRGRRVRSRRSSWSSARASTRARKLPRRY